MKRLALLLLLLVVGCTPVFRITTPIPVTVVSSGGDEAHHAAACDTPSALCGGPSLPAPHVGPTPAPHRFGAGFPSAVPLSSLTQSGATTNQFIKWSGSAWIPATASGTSPTGTGVALVSGGSFVGAAGTVDLSSSTYVANALGLANGGTGVDLSGCGAGKLVQIASGPVFACYTASGDLTLAAGGVATVPSIGGGLWSASVLGGGMYAGYTLLSASASTSGVLFGQSPPVSDVATTPTILSGSNAYASSSTHTTGGDLDLYGGNGATSNGTGGSVNVGVDAPTGSGAEGAFIFNRIISGTRTPYGGIGAYSALPTSFAGLTLGPSRYPNDGMPANIFGKSDGSTIIAGASYIEFNIGSSGLGATYMYADNTGLVAEKNLALGTDPGVYSGGVGVFSLRKAGTNPSGTTTTGIIYADSSTGDLVSYPTGATGPILDVGASVITTKAALNPGASNVSIANCNGGTTTLSAAQSATTMLIVGCTTGTTASTVQSALAPAVGTLWIVRNANMTLPAITFEWASGSGVSVAAGASAVITSDGTNAFAVMQGT